ncbi:hypothetical protein [Nocardia seriolae]|nr:hypothetical protein [Nocardia seriolae]
MLMQRNLAANILIGMNQLTRKYAITGTALVAFSIAGLSAPAAAMEPPSYSVGASTCFSVGFGSATLRTDPCRDIDRISAWRADKRYWSGDVVRHDWGVFKAKLTNRGKEPKKFGDFYWERLSIPLT